MSSPHHRTPDLRAHHGHRLLRVRSLQPRRNALLRLQGLLQGEVRVREVVLRPGEVSRCREVSGRASHESNQLRLTGEGLPA